MTDPNNILLAICGVAFIIVVFLLWKMAEKKKASSARGRFIANVLDRALSQKAVFDLKLLGHGVSIGVSTTLAAINKNGLAMASDHPVSEEWNKKTVEVYFRVRDEDEPVFYVFESTVLSIKASGGGSELVLAMPAHLRVEKKRHFERAHPDADSVIMIAVWPVAPGRRLPRSTADLGGPPIRWKNGEKDMPVRLENISGSGMALRFNNATVDSLPFDSRKGRQIICLVAFKPEKNAARPTVFWCTAEIMNTRVIGNAVAIGLEFTNWAVQEHGDTEIHWAHNSPWRGVKPILEWVKRLETAHN